MTGRRLAFHDAVGLLKSGGVLLSGTDTLPGLHCRADLSPAVGRIIALKGRQEGKSLLVLAGSFDQARMVTADLDDNQTGYCRACWPGPYSLILPADKDLPAPVRSPAGTVAVRVPAVPDLRKLLLAVGFPVVSTSANLAGQPPCLTLEAAAKQFSGNINEVWEPASIKENTENDDRAVPSALIDLTVWPPVLLRAGPREAPQPR